MTAPHQTILAVGRRQSTAVVLATVSDRTFFSGLAHVNMGASPDGSWRFAGPSHCARVAPLFQHGPVDLAPALPAFQHGKVPRVYL